MVAASNLVCICLALCVLCPASLAQKDSQNRNDKTRNNGMYNIGKGNGFSNGGTDNGNNNAGNGNGVGNGGDEMIDMSKHLKSFDKATPFTNVDFTQTTTVQSTTTEGESTTSSHFTGITADVSTTTTESTTDEGSTTTEIESTTGGEVTGSTTDEGSTTTEIESTTGGEVTGSTTDGGSTTTEIESTTGGEVTVSTTDGGSTTTEIELSTTTGSSTTTAPTKPDHKVSIVPYKKGDWKKYVPEQGDQLSNVPYKKGDWKKYVPKGISLSDSGAPDWQSYVKYLETQNPVTVKVAPGPVVPRPVGPDAVVPIVKTSVIGKKKRGGRRKGGRRRKNKQDDGGNANANRPTKGDEKKSASNRKTKRKHWCPSRTLQSWARNCKKIDEKDQCKRDVDCPGVKICCSYCYNRCVTPLFKRKLNHPIRSNTKSGRFPGRKRVMQRLRQVKTGGGGGY